MTHPDTPESASGDDVSPEADTNRYAESVDEIFGAVEAEVGEVPDELSRESVHEDVATYLDDYGVSESMAVRTVQEQTIKKAQRLAGTEPDEEEASSVTPTTPSTDTPTGPVGGDSNTGSSDPERQIESLDVDGGGSDVGSFVRLTGEVLTLYEETNETIQQKGVITDGSGTIEVTVWENSCDESSVDRLEEGTAYEFRGLKIGEYQGEPTASTVRNTDIVEVDESFSRPTVTVSGPVVKVESPSGLISRCSEPDCTRVLNGGMCSEHGEIDDGVVDLRLKAVIDTGTETQRIVLNEEMVAEKFSLDLEEAQQYARDHGGDPSVVEEALSNAASGVYFAASGVVFGEYLNVDTIEPVPVEDLAPDSLVSTLETPLNSG